MKSTHLKCTIHYTQRCINITSIYFQNIFITPKGNLIPIGSHSLFPLPQRLATTNLLYVCMDLLILDISYK